MIISASRRTDIPAFYADWFIYRIRAGYCTVPNPFNHRQVSKVSLKPEDVDVIVFWTRNPRPMFHYLDEIDARGYRYYFQYTVMDNPRVIDPKSPSLSASLKTFRELSDRIRPERVVWRYDPIVFSAITTPDFHLDRFIKIAQALRGYTRRSVISIVDDYRKISKRMNELSRQGATAMPHIELPAGQFPSLMANMGRTAQENGMEIVSCAEEVDLQPWGIPPGKCVDDTYITQIFGLEVVHTKDPSQRGACGCIVSKDIGMYDSCLFGCKYCYATNSFDRARQNYETHDPQSPSLIGWYDVELKRSKQ